MNIQEHIRFFNKILALTTIYAKQKVDDLAFSNSKINEFVLPKSLKSIGFRAFVNSDTKIINLEMV